MTRLRVGIPGGRSAHPWATALWYGFRLLPDVLFALGLPTGFLFLTFALLLLFFLPLALFLLFLKERGMERHDFWLEGELSVFLQFILKVPPLLHQAAHVVGIDFPLLCILRFEQGILS